MTATGMRTKFVMVFTSLLGLVFVEAAFLRLHRTK